MTREQKGWVILAVALAVLTAAPAAGQEVTICDVQEYDENWGSVLEGQTVTVQGMVTIPPGLFQPDRTSFFIEADDCGVNIFAHTVINLSVALGDTIEVEGVVTEFSGLTEIVFSADSDITVTGSSTGEPEPTYMSLQDIPFERNEGRFLRTIGVVASQSPWYFYIEQPWSGAEIQVYQSNPSIDMGVFDIGDTVDVTGILVQYDTEPPYTEGWELSPRVQEDMTLAVPPPPPPPEFWPNASLRIPTQVFRPHGNEIIPIVYLAPDRSEGTMKIASVTEGNETLGTAILSKGCSRPVFLSPGHGVDLGTVVKVISKLCWTRVPEPTKRAHMLSNEIRRSETPS